MVSFYLDNRMNAKGENPVRMSAIVRGTRLLTSSGLCVPFRNWNAVRQFAKGEFRNSRGLDASDVNARLREISDFWEKYEDRCKGSPTLDEMKAAWDGFRGREQKKKNDTEKKSPLEILCDGYLRSGDAVWESRTMAKNRTLISYVKSSGAFAKPDDLTDEDHLVEFVKWLRKSKNLKETTVEKYYTMLGGVLKHAVKNGLLSDGKHTDLPDIPFKVIAQPVIYLEKKDIEAVASFIPEGTTTVEIDGKKLRMKASTAIRIRDMFTFCAYTSLRVSDAKKLRFSDIHEGKAYVTTLKTADSLSIELNSFASEIIERYRQTAGDRKLVFPEVSLATFDKYIKAIGLLCGIDAPVTRTYVKGGVRVCETKPKWELLSSHCARRTFICTALSFGIAPNIIMKWTGHSSYEAMKPYIDIVDSAKADAMKLFEETLKKKKDEAS